MSIFNKIEQAEVMNPSDTLSIKAEEFLSLVDMWIMCSVLMMQIHDNNQELASETIVKISNFMDEVRPILVGDEDE